MRKFDEEMCRGWREDIDTNLVFVSTPSLTARFTDMNYYSRPDFFPQP